MENKRKAASLSVVPPSVGHLSKKLEEEKGVQIQFFLELNQRENKYGASVVLERKHFDTLFQDHSLVVMALRALIDQPARYRGWSILEHQESNDDVENFDQNEYRGGRKKRKPNSMSPWSNTSEGSNDSITHGKESSVLNQMHKVPITIKKDTLIEFEKTKAALRVIVMFLKRKNDKELVIDLSSKEKLNIILMADFLGIRFVKVI